MNKKAYISLSPEAAELNQRFITKLHYDYRRVPNETAYNATQIGNAVLGDQDWPRYSFPRSRRIGFKGGLIGLCLIFISLYIAVFELKVLDQLYIDLFLK